MERIFVIALGALIGTTFYFWCVRALKNSAHREFVRKHTMFHPNSICYIRTILAWLGFYFYFFAGWQSCGIIIYTFAAILDGVDGLVARQCDLITQKGESLDPLCDKLTYLPPLISFAYADLFLISLVWFFVLIEVCGQFLARHILLRYNLSVSANNFGKIKTIICFALVIYCALIDANPTLVNMSDEILGACIMLGAASIVFKFIPRTYYAVIFSSLNLLSGITGIILSVFDHVALAIVAIIMGQMFDLLDGYAAKKHGSAHITHLLDDLADLVTFGLCPLVVFCVQCGENIFICAGIIYAIGVVYRLLHFRFYMHSEHNVPHGIFKGFPIPASAFIVLGGCLILSKENFAIVTIIVTLLMLSPMRFAHFNALVLKKMPRPIFFVCSASVLVVLAYIIKTQDVTLFGSLLLCVTSLYATVSSYVSYKCVAYKL